MSCAELKTLVIDAQLCCGCGACVGVCPAGALSIDMKRSHEPEADESACTDCGLCLRVCPGRGYPVVERSRRDCGETARMIPERGPVAAFLAGHSSDPEIRERSSSGGIATSLLLHLLESGRVDSALAVGMKDGWPSATITRDIREVKGCSGSKYGPVPVLSVLIPALMKEPRRVAAVLTPCQLAGWKAAADAMPRLRESDVVCIGLFCGYVQSYDALGSVASTLGLDYPGGAVLTHWRHGPYPGGLRFERGDGSAVEKPLYRYYDLAIPHFSLPRCFLCPESGNWLADMALGDIHAQGERETVIAVRTDGGREVLRSAEAEGRIFTREMAPGEVEQSTIRHISRSKMLPAIACIEWLRGKNRPVPEFDYDHRSLLEGRSGLIRTLWVWRYRLTFWCRRGWRRQYLLSRPRLMERVGRFLYNFPSSLPGWRLLTRIRARAGG